ncbi:unnamed protein product, partial [Prorocentrum cordatum]
MPICQLVVFSRSSGPGLVQPCQRSELTPRTAVLLSTSALSLSRSLFSVQDRCTSSSVSRCSAAQIRSRVRGRPRRTDGRSYTLEELNTFYRNVYTPAEIKTYWDVACRTGREQPKGKKAKAAAGAATPGAAAPKAGPAPKGPAPKGPAPKGPASSPAAPKPAPKQGEEGRRGRGGAGQGGGLQQGGVFHEGARQGAARGGEGRRQCPRRRGRG